MDIKKLISEMTLEEKLDSFVYLFFRRVRSQKILRHG